jgi:hypothetical protein
MIISTPQQKLQALTWRLTHGGLGHCQIETPSPAACAMGEFDLRRPLTGIDRMIQSFSMSAGRKASD